MYEVIWSSTAEKTYEREKVYILNKWNTNEVIKFINLVDKSVKRLKKFPDIGTTYKGDDKRITISKQTTLFYRISKNRTIELLLFWNNQWNTDDLKQLL